MLSSTTERAHVTELAPATLVDPATSRGAEVLFRLVNQVSRPGNVQDETAALRAIERLAARAPLPLDVQDTSRTLERHVELLDEASAQRLIRWIDPSIGRERGASGWMGALGRAGGRTRRRHLLLLVLLLQAVGVLNQFAAVPLLYEAGVLGAPDSLDRLLEWMPRRARARLLVLADAYLDLTARLMITATVASGDEARPSYFDRLSWVTRVLILLRWRSDGPDPDANPTLRTGRREYRLARRGSFGRLARESAAAKHVLRRLGYRDFQWPRRRLPVGALAVAMVLTVAASVLSFRIARDRAVDWIDGRERAAARVRDFVSDTDPRAELDRVQMSQLPPAGAVERTGDSPAERLVSPSESEVTE